MQLIFVFHTFLDKPNFGFIFLIKISENLSTYSNYQCLSIKTAKFTITASGNSAKNFENLLKILWRKLTLEPRQNQVFKPLM